MPCIDVAVALVVVVAVVVARNGLEIGFAFGVGHFLLVKF
jgi:hypothetical protein